MATITSLLLPATGNSNRGRMPYQVELIIDLTATFSAGKLRVYALLMDVSEQGSTSAAEVARDSI